MDRKELVFFVAVWMVSGLFEYPIAKLFFYSKLEVLSSDFLIAYLFHLMALFVLNFSIPKGFGWFKRERLWVAPIYLFMVFLPVLAWLIIPLILFSFHLGGSYKSFESDWVDVSLAEDNKKSVDISNQKKFAEELDLVNLADVLKSDSLHLKRSAIEKIAKIKDPESIALLLAERSNDSSDVRFFATSALTKIKKEFDLELEVAKEGVRASANDEAKFVLIEVYLKCAKSGLLDQESQAHFMEFAHYHLEEMVKRGTSIINSYWLLIDFYMEREKWYDVDQVITLLQNKLAKQSKQGREGKREKEEIDRLKLIKAKCLSYYYQSDYAALLNSMWELRENSSEKNDPGKNNPEDKEWNSALLWWQT